MEVKEKLSGAFDKAKSVAQNLIKDKEQIQALVTKAWMKAEQGNSAFRDIRERVTALFRMVGAFARGGYRGISTQNLIIAVAGLIYLVNPLDIIPDFLPGLGLIDDAAVLGFVVSQLDQELDKFRAWEIAKIGPEEDKLT